MSTQEKERQDVDRAMDETFGIARTLLQWDERGEAFYLSKLAYELHGYQVEVTIHKPG